MPQHERPPARASDRASFVAPALSLDLYELTMAQSYLDHGVTGVATFSLFARHLPDNRGYFLVAGLEDVLDYVENLSFGDEDLAYLKTTGRFTPDLLDYLRRLHFSGSIRAMPEGTLGFPNEPLLEVTAPIIEAQLLESVIINQVHFQTVIASKAARCVTAAEGRRLVDFSLRRTHGTEAGLKVARAAYLAGFDATSNVLAGQRYGIPIAGTMAHSFVQAFPSELAAFRAFAESYPDHCILLIDTYDTVKGAQLAARVGQELAAAGHCLRGVRLDSGDLITLSFEVRRVLDAAGLHHATIFASGGVDEYLIAQAVQQQAPIDAFGVGTKLGVSADVPYLDMAYKLVAYNGRPVLKLSAGKATWPGAKQVWRSRTARGELEDVIGLADEPGPDDATPLLLPVMRDGRRLHHEPLEQARARARQELASLPPDTRRLTRPARPTVCVSARLECLRRKTAARAARAQDLREGSPAP